MGNDDEQWNFWWTKGPKMLVIAMLGAAAGLFIALVIGLAKDTGSHSAAPLLTTRQACARLLADINMLHGEGAREDAAAVQRVCAEIDAADVDVLPAPVLTIPGVGGGL